MPSILPYTPCVLFKWCICYFHHQRYHYYFITLRRSWHSSALPTFVSHTSASELHFSKRKKHVSSWENTCQVAPCTCGALEILLKEKVTERLGLHISWRPNALRPSVCLAAALASPPSLCWTCGCSSFTVVRGQLGREGPLGCHGAARVTSIHYFVLSPDIHSAVLCTEIPRKINT